MVVVQFRVGEVSRGQTKHDLAGLVDDLVSNSVRTIESQ